MQSPHILSDLRYGSANHRAIYLRYFCDKYGYFSVKSNKSYYDGSALAFFSRDLAEWCRNV